MANKKNNYTSTEKEKSKKRYRAFKELRIWFACGLVLCIGISVFAGIKQAKKLEYSNSQEAQEIVSEYYSQSSKDTINKEEVYNMARSGISRDLVALYGDKYNISAMDLSFLFYREFYDMVSDENFYIDGLGTYGLDPSKPLKDKENMYTELRSFFDELMNTASTGAVNTLQYYELAMANGLTLEEEDSEVIEEEISNLKAAAKKEGMGINDYLDYRYCPGMTEKDARHILELYQLATKQYDLGVEDANDCTDEQIAAYYTEHKDELTTTNIVRYEFEVKPDADGNLTGDDLELAEALAACENEDDFIALSRAHLETLNITEKEIDEALNKFLGTAKPGDFPKGNVEYWLYHYDRKRGDSYIYTDGNFCCVFWIMRPSGKYTFPDADLRLIYIPGDAFSDAAEAKETAYDIYKLATDDPTEENFIKLVEKYSKDSSAKYGGVYEDIVPADLNYKSEDWLFAKGRTVGDIGLVELDGNYYIMYCTGFGDPCWKTLAKRTLVEEKITALDEAVKSFVEVEQNTEVVDEMIFDDLATDRDRGYTVKEDEKGNVTYSKDFKIFTLFNVFVFLSVVTALATAFFFVATDKLKKQYRFNF